MTPRPQRALFALLLTVSLPAIAQDRGGVGLAPGVNGGPVGLARPLPYTRPPMVTAREIQGGQTPADHQAINQNSITKMRGDAGFLSGFALGTPLAASRQPVQPIPDSTEYRHRHAQAPRQVIINNQGPLAVTVGNGNVVQQQSATGSGPIAQQQVATTPSAGPSGGGATNVVTGAGNIIQRAPGGH
jgi:hypothetical protein